MPKHAYNLSWPDGISQLEIELAMIRRGGRFELQGGQYGNGLFFHFRQAQSLLWPDEDHHRWSDLILKTVLEERLTVVQGSRDSSKTRTLAKYAITDYFVAPTETLILMSSTDIRGLELRVWGDLKSLWERAHDRFDFLPGFPLDSRHGIFTDDIGDDKDDRRIRDMRRGILCIPVLDSEGNETRALEKFVGVKQKRRRVVADEAQFLPISYLNILSNLDKAKSDFKAIFTGNPLGQKALDKVAEPECGWENMPEPQRTATWRNKFDGVTINLVGTDSPNYDADRPKNYDYLIGPEDAALVQKRYGPESIEFYSQIKGVRKSNLNARIVLTPDMCKRHGAFEHCIWGHEPITRVLGLDAGFGGDACETILLEYGKDVEGRQVVRFHEPQMIPISLSALESPEDQIAKAAKVMLAQLGVPKSNLFFEAGMRATLAISLARIIGPEVNAVNAGGPATERPVSADLLVDDENGSNRKRLKRCDEHYSKFITECWFSVRLLVECGQAREFPQSVVKEFSEREWTYVRGDRYELETKDDFKQRCHYSPNKADAAAIGFEGVRRLGFEMGRPPEDNPLPEPDWLAGELDKHKREQREAELTYDT